MTLMFPKSKNSTVKASPKIERKYLLDRFDFLATRPHCSQCGSGSFTLHGCLISRTNNTYKNGRLAA